MQWLALLPHRRKILGLISSQDVSVESLHVLPMPAWVLCPKKMQTKGYINPSKLPVDGNMSVDGCLCLYVSPVMNRGFVQGDPAFARRC